MANVADTATAPIEHPGEDQSNELRRRLQAIEPLCMRTYTPSLAVFARSQGSYHYTAEGRKLADFTSGVLVANLGHNPKRWWQRTLGYLSLSAAALAWYCRTFTSSPARSTTTSRWAIHRFRASAQ